MFNNDDNNDNNDKMYKIQYYSTVRNVNNNTV